MKRIAIPFLCAVVAGGCARDLVTVDSTSLRTETKYHITKVAVLDFAGVGGQSIADIMTMNLFKAGYEVVERDRISRLVFEQQIGADGYKKMSDLEKAQKLGRVLNADAIFTGELVALSAPDLRKRKRKFIAYPQARMEIVARAIEARTGEIIWLGRANVTCQAGLGKFLTVLDFIDRPCAELTRAFGTTGRSGSNVIALNYDIGNSSPLGSLSVPASSLGDEELSTTLLTGQGDFGKGRFLPRFEERGFSTVENESAQIAELRFTSRTEDDMETPFVLQTFLQKASSTTFYLSNGPYEAGFLGLRLVGISPDDNAGFLFGGGAGWVLETKDDTQARFEFGPVFLFDEPAVRAQLRVELGWYDEDEFFSVSLGGRIVHRLPQLGAWIDAACFLRHYEIAPEEDDHFRTLGAVLEFRYFPTREFYGGVRFSADDREQFDFSVGYARERIHLEAGIGKEPLTPVATEAEEYTHFALTLVF